MNLSKLLKVFIPTSAQLAVCALLAFVIEALVFQSIIVARFFTPTNLSPFLDAGKQIQLSHLNSFAIVRLFVQGAFWAVVGLCAYIIYLGLVNAVVEARNEVVVSTEFANKGKSVGLLKNIIWQAGLVVALILGLWITALVGFDFWFGLMGNLVIGGFTVWHVAGALLSLIGLSLNLYLLWMLAEAALVADR
jgi:hypothetical protein